LTPATRWIHDHAVDRQSRRSGVEDGSVGKRAKGEALGLIVRELRDEILDGRLRAGERIHQEAVAERFGTSRLPVREALRQLQNEGLVVVLPNAGAHVVRLDQTELAEVYLLRERLEPLAVERAAVALGADHLATMRREAAWMEQNDPGGREAEWLAHDRAFHMASFASAGLPRLLTIIESLWNVAEQYRRAYLSVRSGVLEPTLLEHRLLVDALERHDGEDAARVLEMHIRRTRLGLAGIPEIFDT
jgi:DNA-binding GntR family transcriptional regulator